MLDKLLSLIEILMLIGFLGLAIYGCISKQYDVSIICVIAMLFSAYVFIDDENN